jgi:hypothetical protein
MVFRGIIRMTGCELCVTVRNDRLMRSVCVVAFLIVLGRIAVMQRGQFMMVGRREMVLLAREHFRHGLSNAVMSDSWPAKRPEFGQL